MTRRIVTVLAALAIGPFVVAGCGGDVEGPPTYVPSHHPDAVVAPLIREHNEILPLPLDSYRLTPHQQANVDRAVTKLIAECLAALALEMPAAPAPETGEVSASNRRYGLFDALSAATIGYHIAPPGQGGSPIGDVAMDPRVVAAITGRRGPTVGGRPIPEGGCAGQALRVIAPDGSLSQSDLVSDLDSTAYQYAERSAAVQAAFGAWSDCMTRSGFRYTTPWQANDDPRWTDPVNRAEHLATAVADVRCKQEVNLIGIWNSMEIAYQKILISDHHAKLEPLRATLAAQVQMADLTLAKPSTTVDR